MHASKLFLAVAASANVSAKAIASPQAISTLGLGQPCSSSAQCANGAACYAANSMQVPSCGHYQAACTQDTQCAFNTCVGGFCRGPLASSIIASAISGPSAPIATPTTPSTGPGTVALGTPCSLGIPNQCASGATCFAVNPMTVPLCGNFQAPCASNSQCAFDTCISGVCSGFPSSLSTPPHPNGISSMAGPTPRPTVRASSGASLIVVPTISGTQIHNNGTASASVSWLGGQHRTSTTTATTKHSPTPSPSTTLAPTKKKSSAGQVSAEISALMAVAAFIAMAM